MEAQAESESVRVKGEAEAYAIEAKARAEAEQMAKKADAWKEYQDAAIVDMLLESMPQVRLSAERVITSRNQAYSLLVYWSRPDGKVNMKQ